MAGPFGVEFCGPSYHVILRGNADRPQLPRPDSNHLVTELVDRFFREFTTAGTHPQVMYSGRTLHYDPLSNNDYWWTGPKDQP